MIFHKYRFTAALALITPLAVIPGSARAKQNPAAVKENPVAAIERLNSSLERFVLDNGMVCLLKKDSSAPVVTIQIWIGTGSIHEDEHLGAGLSHAVEHMIFKGTKRRSPVDITREINNAGGDVNAYTTLDRTVFLTDMPSRNWRVGLDVLSDAVMNAAFPADEWKKEQEVILREFAMGKDSPEREINKLLWATAFSVHPYRVPTIGHEDIFRKITRDDIANFFKRNYVPDNMIVVVTGDINTREVEAEIRKTFAGFERRSRTPLSLPPEPAQLAPRFARKTGAYNVSRLEWVYHTVPISHPDAPAMDLLAIIAGHGRSSRLVSEIQENLKLVHSISASSDTLKEAGLFGLSAVFSPEKEKEVLSAIEKELSAWLDSKFSTGEIEKARRILLSSELSNLQTTAGQANNYGSGEFYTGDARFSETYIKLLNAITPAKIQAAARKYLLPSNRTIVILSPSGKPDKAPAKEVNAGERKPEKVILDCGIPLLVREDHKLPVVYFCAALRGGVLAETEANNGISRLMAELLTRGTARRSSEDIGRQIESMGASLQAFSDQNNFGLKGRCLSGDSARFMEIMADCLLNASFPESELDKQKAIQLSEIDRMNENPMFIVHEELRRLLFPGHQYRLSSTGSHKSVSGIKRQEIKAHFQKLVSTGNLVLSVSGDISTTEARALAEKHLGSIRKSSAPSFGSLKANPVLPAKNRKRIPKEQAIVLMGFPGVDVKDPRADALALLQIATSGLSSELGRAIREERGLAYFCGTRQITGTEPGFFSFYAGTREDAADEVEKLITAEMQRIISSGITSEETERARNQIIADYEMSLQDNLGIAATCAINELNGLGHSYSFTSRARFEALTGEDIRKAAASILSTNMAAVSMVLPETPGKIK